MEDTSPSRVCGDPGSVCLDLVPVDLATASVDVHLGGPYPSLAFPDVSDDPEAENDGSGKILLEEALGGGQASIRGEHSNGGVELDGWVSSDGARVAWGATMILFFFLIFFFFDFWGFQTRRKKKKKKEKRKRKKN